MKFTDIYKVVGDVDNFFDETSKLEASKNASNSVLRLTSNTRT